ncbi:MAG: hypothetical protein V1850_04015, partial [Candidatus Bathyarchaeota archaeon]
QAFSFITSTELANNLTRQCDVPFRASHKIVGTLCKYLIESNLSLSNVTSDLLEKIAFETSGINLKLKLEDIRSSIDPTKFIEAHSVIGGPAPKEVRRAIESRKKMMTSLKKGLTVTKSQLTESDRRLQDAIRNNTIHS